MDMVLKNLDAYFEDLKKNGGKIPSWKFMAEPHLKVISAKAHVDYKDLLKPPYRQHINLAVQDIGLEKHLADVSEKERRENFEQNCRLIDHYLNYLEAGGYTLPEDPKQEGDVFFAQVASESGVNLNALILKGIETERAYKIHLHEIISSAIPRLGLGVRVLPQASRDEVTPITYERFLERGTTQRKHELEGKRGDKSQLYNSRYALNLFVRVLELEMSASIGREFTVDFGINIERVIRELKVSSTRKKFQTEIRWWQMFYQRLLKEQLIPNEFHEAFSYLVNTSGLSFSILSRFIGTPSDTLRRWYQGANTPSPFSLDALSQAELIFKVPAGTLVNKVARPSAYGHLPPSQLPDFLQQTPALARRIKRYLPDDFCKLTPERQQEIVHTIHSELVGNANPFVQKHIALLRLPYRLKQWPERLAKEFDDLAVFKMAERPPIGIKRNGTWRSVTKKIVRNEMGYFFGAICLQPDTDDIRLRGLGVRPDDLTIALLACPKLVDWFIRFKCENRNSYTDFAISLISTFRSMVNAETGWLRQHPQLASRLRPISWNMTELVSSELIAEARSCWDEVCDKAVSYYDHLISEITPLIHVARDPFHSIEGIVKMEDPMDAFSILIDEMKRDMPDPNRQPTRYHVMSRNCALVVLLAVTGLRRETLAQLDYTGDHSGHLYLQDGTWVLSIPRSFFKQENSPYFGSRHAQRDYYMELPSAYGLPEILSEYLNVSRPYLLNRYYPDCKEHPLFVNSFKGKHARFRPASMSDTYSHLTEKYIAEKKYRGTGIPEVKKHGPHSARHIRGTAAVKKTGSLQVAADANHHSVEMARKHYALFLPKDRNRRVNDALFGVKP